MIIDGISYGLSAEALAERKGRVFASVTGQPFWASHWTDLPEMPQ